MGAYELLSKKNVDRLRRGDMKLVRNMVGFSSSRPRIDPNFLLRLGIALNLAEMCSKHPGIQNLAVGHKKTPKLPVITFFFESNSYGPVQY